ncbi:MAG TPA: HepT-like ribonuclease domain-containing protein [Thermoanaerobaculia bacterium]|nr:HepT-like ribonuclease domain-containing protein [Thermoanaerobaculia bacterium]
MSTQRDPRTLLDDIRQAAAGIERVVVGKTLTDYESDEDLQSIVERRFTIIGEALKRLERTDAALFREIPGARDIIDFRNVLAHGYEMVNHRTVWDAALEDLPKLVAAVVPLLEKLG